MRAKVLLIGAVAGLVLAACQTTGESGFMPRQFEGRSVDLLTEAYGEPVSVTALEDGRALHVYQTVSLEDWRQLDEQARRAIGTSPQTRRYDIVHEQTNEDDIVIGSQRTTFTARPNPPYAEVLCTIEAISGADNVIQSVSVASDLCLTIRS